MQQLKLIQLDLFGSHSMYLFVRADDFRCRVQLEGRPTLLSRAIKNCVHFTIAYSLTLPVLQKHHLDKACYLLSILTVLWLNALG